MKVSDFVGSGDGKFLRADEIKGKKFRLTVSGVEARELDDLDNPEKKKKKCVLSFEGREKKIVMNGGSMIALGDAYGRDDIERDWVGKEVEVSTDTCNVGSGYMICVRPVVEVSEEVPF